MDNHETDTCWHLMVTTCDGKVSMLRNLDAPTARQAYQRLQPRDRPVKYINQGDLTSWSGGSWSSSGSDVGKVDILGPQGVSLDPWRDAEPRIVDLAPEAERQRQYQEQARKGRQTADEMAAKLNVITELTPHLSRSDYRCGECGVMQPSGSLQYFVPDGMRRKDDAERFKERVRATRYNGHSTGWCSSCAPKEPKQSKLSYVAPTVATVPATTEKTPWWKW